MSIIATVIGGDKNLKMKKILIILFAFANLSVFSQRQSSNIGERSITLGVGPSTLLIGDIGAPLSESYLFLDGKAANSMVSMGYHIFHNYKFASHISIHSSSYEREDTKYLFRSDVFQLNIRGEYHILNSNFGYQPNELYLTGGIGFLYGNYMKRLKVSETSTVRTPGFVMAAVVPMGIGYRYNIYDKFKVGASFDLFYVPSDMIEGKGGVGSGYPHDILASFMLNFSYTFNAGKRLW